MESRAPHSASPPALDRLLLASDRLVEGLGRSVPPLVRLERLQQLPPGTFGRALADFLEANGLQPLNGILRRKQLHDSVHVLTGYGADPVGEAEVQAFLLGAKFFLPNALIGLALLGLIRRQLPTLPETRQQIRDRLWRAYWRGRHARFDPDTWRPEEVLACPLAVVRDRFRV